MADIASNLYSWSTSAASNAPLGSTVIGTGMDDNLREIQAVVRTALASVGANIASAGTTDLGAVAGLKHLITGTTTITSFGTVASGIWKVIVFEGALTLTHNATSLILPSAANITTVAGDVAIVLSEGSGNWRCLSYVRANGASLVNAPMSTARLLGRTTAGTGTPEEISVGASLTLSTGTLNLATNPEIGSATATTQAPSTNNTTVATTAFLQAAVLGRNQTWQDVTGSRSGSVVYTNSGNAPIAVSIISAPGTSIDFVLAVNSVTVSRSAYNGTSGACNVFAIVPPSVSYELTISAGSVANWMELRV